VNVLLPPIIYPLQVLYLLRKFPYKAGTFLPQMRKHVTAVDDSEANLYRRYFDAEEVSTEIATDVLLRDYEKRVASLVMNTGNAIGSTNVTTEWSTASTATPKADVKAGIQSQRAASGLEPNAIAMSKKVFENTMVTAEIKDYLQYTSPHLVEGVEAQRRMLANYFGVDQVLVGGAIEDSAKKGQAFSIADLWDDEYVALLRISAGGNRLREPVFGRTFLWTEDSPQTVVTETYREEGTRSNIVRVRQNVDEAIIFSGGLYLLGNITA